MSLQKNLRDKIVVQKLKYVWGDNIRGNALLDSVAVFGSLLCLIGIYVHVKLVLKLLYLFLNAHGETSSKREINTNDLVI